MKSAAVRKKKVTEKNTEFMTDNQNIHSQLKHMDAGKLIHITQKQWHLQEKLIFMELCSKGTDAMQTGVH